MILPNRDIYSLTTPFSYLISPEMREQNSLKTFLEHYITKRGIWAGVELPSPAAKILAPGFSRGLRNKRTNGPRLDLLAPKIVPQGRHSMRTEL